jgi:hypothetical protein
LQFLTQDLPKILGSMAVGTDRIREIVLSLRNFSRQDESRMRQADIHDGLDSTLLILQNRLKPMGSYPGIQVIKEYGKLPLVECHVGQINQVFMNLLSNAIDALRSRDGITQENSLDACLLPSITIRTQMHNSEAITVCIADNGPGMTDAVQAQLFEPFFTTKPMGKGTGIGLSISQQIVEETHQGALWCISQVNRGAEFWLKLPIQSSPTAYSRP